MELNSSLAAIRQLIGRGELETALSQLVALLDAQGEPAAEYAKIVRVNQAEFYQLKSKLLLGTVANEDARLITNQLTDNVLKVVNDLAAGRMQPEGERPPTRSQAWRYYLAGGIVALAGAILLWRFFGGSEENSGNTCPDFGKDAGMRVMILPFKQTGVEKNARPEFEIMDALNDLIAETPQMKAIADVHEKYDIDSNYPNPAEAADIARGCEAQLIVWGRLNQSGNSDYSLDVRYKLLDAGGVRASGDTLISRLLTVTDEGRWEQDVESVTQVLYLVLANQLRTPIASGFIARFDKKLAVSMAEKSDSLAVDTVTGLALADYYIRMKQPENAIAEYDKILAAYPLQPTALLKRGALRYEKGDYAGAADDLEAAIPASRSATPAFREIRIDAFLRSGQPEKAEQEAQTVKREGSKDNAWVDDKNRQIRDSTTALAEKLLKMEQAVQRRPSDKRARLDAGEASLGLGYPDRAIRNASIVLKNDPRNEAAIEQTVEAYVMKGDTVNARRTIDQARRNGVNVKAIDWAPAVAPLVTPSPPASSPRQ